MKDLHLEPLTPVAFEACSALQHESEQIRLSYLRSGLDQMASVISSNCTFRQEFRNAGASMLKNSFLFLQGKYGVVGSIALNVLDEAKPLDSFAQQGVDVVAGAAKALATRALFHRTSTMQIVPRSGALALGTAVIENGLTTSNYYDPVGSFNLSTGLHNISRICARPNYADIACNLVTASAARGILRDVRSPFISTVLTGSCFGMITGSYSELLRQRECREDLSAGKIVFRGILQSVQDTVVSMPAGYQAMHQSRIHERQCINERYRREQNESIEARLKYTEDQLRKEFGEHRANVEPRRFERFCQLVKSKHFGWATVPGLPLNGKFDQRIILGAILDVSVEFAQRQPVQASPGSKAGQLTTEDIQIPLDSAGRAKAHKDLQTRYEIDGISSAKLGGLPLDESLLDWLPGPVTRAALHDMKASGYAFLGSATRLLEVGETVSRNNQQMTRPTLEHQVCLQNPAGEFAIVTAHVPLETLKKVTSPADVATIAGRLAERFRRSYGCCDLKVLEQLDKGALSAGYNRVSSGLSMESAAEALLESIDRMNIPGLRSRFKIPRDIATAPDWSTKRLVWLTVEHAALKADRLPLTASQIDQAFEHVVKNVLPTSIVNEHSTK